MNNTTFNDGLGEWRKIGMLTINDNLSLSDSSYFYDEPLIVKLKPDQYKLEINTLNIDGYEHVKTVRILPNDIQFCIGQVLGHVNVDFGQIAICDRAIVENIFENLGDAGMPSYYDQLSIEDLSAPISLNNSIFMYVVKPGFGDGNYSVSALLSPQNELLGVEINCI